MKKGARLSMFVDEVKVQVVGGRGGNGLVAFRREKYVEFGGPAGGTGGNGGDIIFEGDEGLSTLLDLRYNKIIKAEAGENGRSKGMNGANAIHTIIRVPVGTTIYDDAKGTIIGDITMNKQRVIVAHGGRGGRGNIAFATSRNPAPSICEKGEEGENRLVRVELHVLADVGLVGFPSVGKSTLISAISKARPKIAAYHFTTLVPNLGMVSTIDGRSFVVADLPGLIEGASQGAGLGFQFLRHIERCRVIIHVIDMSGSEGRDPYSDYEIIRNELKEYKYHLLERPFVIAANKMDLPEAQANLEKFKSQVGDDVEIFPISAYTNEGLRNLLLRVADILAVTKEFSLYDEEDKETYLEYRFIKGEEFFHIELLDNVYVVTGEPLRKLFEMTDFNHDEAVRRFARQLRSFGVDEALRKLGVKNGDTVRIFDYEFEFID